MFFDSDDYVDVTMCGKLYAVAVEEDSDIVICEYKEGKEDNFREIDQHSIQVMGRFNYKERPILYMRNEPKAIVTADLLMHSEKEFCDMLRNHETDKIKGNYDTYY